MSATPCHSLSELRYRTPPNWDEYYESGMPDILYRVHATDSRTRYSPTEGFEPTRTPTRTCSDGANHRDAINHCLSYKLRLPSPFISMSCSFLYVFWEALWRNLRFHIQDVNIQIWFIDTTSLKRCRPVRSDLFHAVDLVQKKCERSSCSATPEQHTTALDFASVFDEVLVLGGVPPEAIIGNVTLAQLLLLLPPYFFTQVPSGCPIPRDCEHLIRGVPRLPLRDAHWELRRNVPTVDTLPHVFEQAELALKLARRVCRDVPLSESDVRDLLRRLALAIANWVIRWEDTMIPTFDNEWACSGSVWITEYLKYRISGGPVLRGARKTNLTRAVEEDLSALMGALSI